MQTPIAQALSDITLGPPVNVESLAMFPLVGPQSVEREPFYSTLDQAIGNGWTEITEVSEGGRVPELRLVNKGTAPVFILDGEELVGAKQNRVVNLSILAPPEKALTIPVSCVEAGRWHSRSRVFSAAPRTHYAAGRVKRIQQVTASMCASRGRHSDQAEVWADIAEKSARLGVESQTSAMEDIFASHADFTERCVEALRPVERQCGALFIVDGRVVGFDLFDRALTLRRLMSKLVRSVAIDALDSAKQPGPRPSPPSPLVTKVAEHFLARAASATVHDLPALGLGRDMRLVAPKIAGAALSVDDAVVHLSAFHL